MKKIAVLLSLFLLVMSSCSKSDESVPAPNRVPKRGVAVAAQQADSQHHHNVVN